MSTVEQDQAIVRLVRKRKELRERKALIESELRAAGESLRDIGDSLRHLSSSFPHLLTDALATVQRAPDICQMQCVAAMITELSGVYESFAELNRNAAELGID
jgi:hypothetical protein